MHRIVRFMNGDKHFVGFISDIYKLLGKYQSVGYMLKWFTVSVKGRMGAILRQEVLQSNTQTMKKS